MSKSLNLGLGRKGLTVGQKLFRRPTVARLERTGLPRWDMTGAPTAVETRVKSGKF